MFESPNDARRALLTSLFDDAALYPPARLDMADALVGHMRHRAGLHGWMTGRFVCPASRLGELDATLPRGRSVDVSVVLETPAAGDFADGLAADLAAVVDAEQPERLAVCSVEVRLPAADDQAGVAQLAEGLVRTGLAGRIDAFAEVDVVERPPAEIAQVVGAIAAAQRRLTDRARGLPGPVIGDPAGSDPAGRLHPADAGRRLAAKVRCGGERQEVVPSAEELGGFLLACARAGIPYKATAGLHHPHPRLDADGGGILEHGFLALAAAAALLSDEVAGARRTGTVALGPEGGARARYAPPTNGAQIDLATLVDVLSGPDPDDLVLSAAGLRAGERLVGAETLAKLRGEWLLGIGCCTIDDPVADLAALGVLGDDGVLIGDGAPA